MMVDYRPPGPMNLPHRKAMPSHSNRSDLRPLTQIRPDHTQASSTHSPASQQPSSMTSSTPYSAFPPRTTSTTQPITSSPASGSLYDNPIFTSRRTPSQSTTSTTGFTTTTQTMTNYPPSRTPSNVSSKISRTSSNRSVVTPASYVALMRKQKATVWCDRAQSEDPRIIAQQKLARQRATRELTGLARGTIAHDSRSSTSGSMGSGSLGVRSKIRHHGVPKAQGVGFGRGNMMSGGGVPMRLSANEVGDEGTYTPVGGAGAPPLPHKRNSSLQSRERDSRFLTVDTTASRRLSQGSTPISAEGVLPELQEETPVPSQGQNQHDYFPPEGKSAGGSGSERENSFGVVGQMQGPPAVARREMAGTAGKGKTVDDLKRRGSVDERGLFPQGTGRLVIANPDADSDSD